MNDLHLFIRKQANCVTESSVKSMVEVTGFEPATPTSRTQQLCNSVHILEPPSPILGQ